MDPTLRTSPDPRSTFITSWALCLDFLGIVPCLVSGRGVLTILDGPAHGRPKFEAGDARGHVEKVFGQHLLEYGLHPVAAFEARVSHLSHGGGTCTDRMSMPFL